MSRKEKLLKKFLETPARKDLTFSGLKTLLTGFGFAIIEGSGSRVKFYNEQKNLLVVLHKPHPSDILNVATVRDIQEVLRQL